ncbi:DUF1285 domain-containing protein [Falsiruegeria mediterranea]|uniref:Proteophosphoglycan n=1 Tax=Falsiruegeria mediterranea M17 TaxID=1200281 RepID=A0A2R8C342_9RHOB|nr:DUF1285 domain-containing protein [Falsiruegeria mediterranea]SPJ26830.1 hypothetical protein TRM7615_00299 [Falsiruegeria mediterranea M17]
MSGQKVVTPSVDHIAQAVKSTKDSGLPPVHLWNPPFCGDLDIQILRNGTWIHEGRPITRPKMVQLFSSILKREGDKYYLVTPVEKVGITVEDAPFVAIDVDSEGEETEQVLTFTTHVGDQVMVSADNPIRLAEGTEPTPYVMVRAGLEARIDRKSFYRMVELGVHHDGWFGVWSAGSFFGLMPSEQVEG